MAMASTSAAVLQSLSSPFVAGSRRSLLNAAMASKSAAAAGNSRRLLVVAAAAQKKSWIPAVKSDSEFINPPWLDGS